MTKELTVFYDGECPLCSREIDMYRARPESDRIHWQDITEADFHPADFGLTQEGVRARFHAKRASGEIISGVEAFSAIWDIIPGFSILSWMAKSRFIRPIMDLSYISFAKIRPLLPKRKGCESDACEISASQRGQ